MRWPYLVLTFAIAVGAGSATADENDLRAQGAQPSPGETLSRSLRLAESARVVALPEGEWTVVARVAEPEPAGVLVLAKANGAHLEGLIWLRSSEEPGRRLSTWCADGEIRQYYQPLEAADGLQGCLWVRQWSTRVNPEDLEEYWWRAFDRIERDGATVPIGFVAAGYYIADSAPAVTIEYSFNADDVSADEVVAWARRWQDAVLAGFRGAPEAPPAPAWP